MSCLAAHDLETFVSERPFFLPRASLRVSRFLLYLPDIESKVDVLFGGGARGMKQRLGRMGWCQAVICVLLGLLLAGCIGGDLQLRRAQSAQVAGAAGWQRSNLDAGPFVLVAFAPPSLLTANTLTVYIEGDGLAWIDPSTPSFDPTPLNPLGLRLALRDPSGAAVYLARPCQFVAGDERRGCLQRYWTGQRFAPQVIDASNNAIEQLKQRFGARQLVLVGYSGGAAVAALVAARREDVVRLISVAGNLDHRTWSAEQRLSPLTGSLNPADAWTRLQSVSQVHFIGGQDRVLGASIVRAYAARFPSSAELRIQVMPAFDHECCWVEQWPELLDAIAP